MDLDEVYYDAGAHAGAVIAKTRDAGEKKIIENEVTDMVNYRARGTEKSICCVVSTALLNVTLNFLNSVC